MSNSVNPKHRRSKEKGSGQTSEKPTSSWSAKKTKQQKTRVALLQSSTAFLKSKKAVSITQRSIGLVQTREVFRVIIESCAQLYNAPPTELISLDKGTVGVQQARVLAIYLLHEAGYPAPTVSKLFQRTEKTVHTNRQRFMTKCLNRKVTSADMEKITEILNTNLNNNHE